MVGTGGVGAAVGAVARRRDFFERMTFADLDPARPEALVARLDDGRFAAGQIDASDEASVAALAREADVVLNATDPRFNPPIFAAAVEATEEAVLNALWAAPDVTGREGRIVLGLPHDEVLGLLRERRALA